MPELTLPNGVRLHWREAGEPAGAPVVWIHGGSVEDSSMMVADLEPFFGEEALARLKARPERYRETVGRLRTHSVASLLALLDETYSRADWLEDCAKIRCPVLVVAGSEDHFPSLEQSRHVAETIPGARLHVVQGGPHFPNRTHRHEVQQAIRIFFEDVGVLTGGRNGAP